MKDWADEWMTNIMNSLERMNDSVSERNGKQVSEGGELDEGVSEWGRIEGSATD